MSLWLFVAIMAGILVVALGLSSWNLRRIETRYRHDLAREEAERTAARQPAE